MKTENLIAADLFCTSHNIDISFISNLQNIGLIEITTINDTGFIHVDQLRQIEKMIRLYYEMDINLEGIETIFNLLERINIMQDEITELRNRLRLYEDI